MPKITLKLSIRDLADALSGLPQKDLEQLMKKIRKKEQIHVKEQFERQLTRALKEIPKGEDLMETPFFSMKPVDLGKTKASEIDRIIAEEARR